MALGAKFHGASTNHWLDQLKGIEVLTTAIAVLASFIGYRGVLMLTSGAPAGSMRSKINSALGGGGPGPV